MITNQGFVLVQHENSETGEVTMVPFFPYVLNSSIICEDPIMIDEHLHLTSERWTVVDGVDSVDKTSYIFSCNYGDLTEDEIKQITNYCSKKFAELTPEQKISKRGTSAPEEPEDEND